MYLLLNMSALQNQEVLSIFFPHSHEMHLFALLVPFTPK